MEYWNVVITVHEGYYKKARELLKPLGSARKTEFFNVLVMQVSDTSAAMEMLNAVMVKEPQARDAIARFARRRSIDRQEPGGAIGAKP